MDVVRCLFDQREVTFSRDGRDAEVARNGALVCVHDFPPWVGQPQVGRSADHQHGSAEPQEMAAKINNVAACLRVLGEPGDLVSRNSVEHADHKSDVILTDDFGVSGHLIKNTAAGKAA